MNTYSIVFQSIAFLSGLAAFNVARPVYRMLIALVTLTVVNEIFIVGYLIEHSPRYINTAYNLFSLLDMITWYFYFYQLFNTCKERRIILGVALLSVLLSMAEIFYLKDWTIFHTETMRVYNLTIVFFCLYYFYKAMLKRYYHFMSEADFWLCVGALIYHMLLFLNFSTISEYNYWKVQYAPEVYYLLQNIANTCYYLLLTIAFGCLMYRQRKLKDQYQRL